ncbi:MAG: hypothetical protein HY589_04950, partial [Candidatus Omnitrophica bacterium]|nr:hypothetical protein [Candidatus Omnitrophota bacterium]
ITLITQMAGNAIAEGRKAYTDGKAAEAEKAAAAAASEEAEELAIDVAEVSTEEDAEVEEKKALKGKVKPGAILDTKIRKKPLVK